MKEAFLKQMTVDVFFAVSYMTATCSPVCRADPQDNPLELCVIGKWNASYP